MIAYVSPDEMNIINNKNRKKTEVIIYCTTYNHINTIGDAITGFLAQKTEYDYKILLFDDCSTDGTRERLLEFEKDNPKIIQLVLATENTYKNDKGLQAFIYCVKSYFSFNYIAFCEGDDYWISDRKLQNQISYMYNHPECGMYIQNAVVHDMKTNRLRLMINGFEKGIIDNRHIINRGRFNPPSASVVLKKDIFNMRKFKRLFTHGVGDYPMQLISLLYGYTYYDNAVNSVYRYELKGSWTDAMHSNMNMYLKHRLERNILLLEFNEISNNKYELYVIDSIQKNTMDILSMIKNNGISIDETECPDNIKKLYHYMYDEVINDHKLKDYCNNYKHIVLFGAGVFGNKMYKELKNIGINIDGFAKTSVCNDETYCGLPVWQLNKIPLNMQNTGIIISILPYDWIGLMESLKNANITDFFAPYFVEMDI